MHSQNVYRQQLHMLWTKAVGEVRMWAEMGLPEAVFQGKEIFLKSLIR